MKKEPSTGIAITFAGGAGSVTGANFLLETPHARILIDCGLFQGCNMCEKENYGSFSYDPASIDALLVTHAHLDHVGRIPKLVREGFRGPIYSTEPTKDLAEASLLDAVEIMALEAHTAGREPLYGRDDVIAALSLWQSTPYHEALTLPGGITAFPKNAGHILGSAMYEIAVAGEKIVFTGDLGNSPSSLLPDTEPITGATYLVMESVYGDRSHEHPERRREMLGELVREAVARGGTLLIPAFSIERTQVILYELHKLIEGGTIASLPIYLDSPLAIRVTDIYRKHRTFLKTSVQGEIEGGGDLFSFRNLHFSESSNESRAIAKDRRQKIVIAGSGMSMGGRVLGHEVEYLPDPKNTLLLAGYQVPGSIGRELQDGARSVLIRGTRVPVRAKVATIHGYSAHGDREHLLSFVEAAAPTLKRAFVAMGEPKASLHFVQRVRDYLGVDAYAPHEGEKVFL